MFRTDETIADFDPELARETYLEALAGAMLNDIDVAGGAPTVAAAARKAPAGAVCRYCHHWPEARRTRSRSSPLLAGECR